MSGWRAFSNALHCRAHPDLWARSGRLPPSPTLLHERVYIHILCLLGKAVQGRFHKAVEGVCGDVFGPGFRGFSAAPLKSYARMLGPSGAQTSSAGAAARMLAPCAPPLFLQTPPFVQ